MLKAIAGRKKPKKSEGKVRRPTRRRGGVEEEELDASDWKKKESIWLKTTYWGCCSGHSEATARGRAQVRRLERARKNLCLACKKALGTDFGKKALAARRKARSPEIALIPKREGERAFEGLSILKKEGSGGEDR